MRKIETKFWFLAAMITIAVLLTFTVPFVRWSQGNPVVASGGTYTFMHDFSSGNVHGNPVYYLLSFLPISLGIMLFLFPLVIIITSVLLFSSLIINHVKTEREYYIVMLLFVLSPLFLSICIGVQEIALLYPMILLLYKFRDGNIFILGILTLVMTILWPVIGVFILIPLVYLNEKRGKFASVMSISLIFGVVVRNLLPFTFTKTIFGMSSINGIFAFLGANIGYTFIITLLGIVGIVGNYKIHKNKKFSLIVMVLIIVTLFLPLLRIPGTLILIFFAAKTFSKLLNNDWEHKMIHRATIVLVGCMLFFALSTMIQDEVSKEPIKAQVNALYFLRTYSQYDDSYLLTNLDYAPFVKYYSGLTPYLIEGNDEVYETALNIFHSRDYEKISYELRNGNISFILIDRDMTNGNIWSNEREELLFVMAHNKNFIKIYEREGVIIYQFKG